MISSLTEQRTVLEAVTTASLRPDEALPRLLHHLECATDTQDAAEAVYEALRGMVWTFVSSREDGRFIDLWGDLILRVRQAMRVRSALIAERLTVLADFLEQSTRFPRLHPKEELAGRKHVRAILEVLVDNGGCVERRVVARETGLKDANLSRIIANLASSGLVARHQEGSGVTIALTAEGRMEASRLGLKVGSAAMFSDPAVVAAIASMWRRSGAALAVVEDGRLQACDDAFATLIGDVEARLLTGTFADTIRRRLSDATLVSDAVLPYEVERPDGTVIGLIECVDGSRSMWFGCDVTAYRRRIENLKQWEKLQSKSLSGRRRSIQPMAVDADGGWPAIAAFRDDVLTPTHAIGYLTNTLMLRLDGDALSRTHSRALLTDLNREVDHLRSLVQGYTGIGELFVGECYASPVRLRETIQDVLRQLSDSGRDAVFDVRSSAPSEVEIFDRGYRGILHQVLLGVVGTASDGVSIAVECKASDKVLLTSLNVRSSGASYVGAKWAARSMLAEVIRHFGGRLTATVTEDGTSTSFSWPVKVVRAKRGYEAL